MNSKLLSQIKSDLKFLLKNPEIIDIILFGSALKGKANPKDIDIALISENQKIYDIEGFHTSIINPKEFVQKPSSLITTIIQEGYSLKNNNYFAELLRFKTKMMYIYKLNNLENSKKVKIVRILRGNNQEKGMVSKYEGEWLSNQVFLIPPESDYVFQEFFVKNNINFKKKNILIN